MEQVAGRPSLITTLNQSKISLTPTPPTDPSTPPPPRGGAEGTPPSPRMGRGGTQFAPLRPAAWGIHPAGGESVFPSSQSRPALLGKGAAGAAAPNAQTVFLGSERVESKGP